MPYINLPGGGKIWEGPRTEREEMELMRRINGVARFPSANHRSKLRDTRKDLTDKGLDGGKTKR